MPVGVYLPAVTTSTPTPSRSAPTWCPLREAGGRWVGAEQHHRHHTNGDRRELDRRQVVGPTPKPHCRRQCGNAARAAALGLCSPPPSVKDGTREVEGAPPRLERVLALACGSERRTDRRSARRHLCREDVGYERVYSPTPARSTFLPQPRKCVEGTRSHTCAPDEGTPPRRGAGPAEWICMHGQVAPTRKGPAAYRGSSWTAARFSHRELGRRRDHLEPAAGALPSWQAVSTSLTRALGGGEPFRPLVALSHMRDSAGAVIDMVPVQLVGVCGTSVCLAPSSIYRFPFSVVCD